MRGRLHAGGPAGRRGRARRDRRRHDERRRGQHPRQRQGTGAGARARAPVRATVARAAPTISARRSSSTSPRAAWSSPAKLARSEALAGLAAHQRAAGVVVDDVDAAGLLELEPHLARDVAGGAWYPQDAQVQPMLATAEPAASRPVGGRRGPRGDDGHRVHPRGRRGCRRADRQRDGPGAPRAVGRQRGRHLGGRARGARRDADADPAAPRVHPGDRAAATGRAPQGLHGRVRRQRRLVGRGPSDLGRHRGDARPGRCSSARAGNGWASTGRCRSTSSGGSPPRRSACSRSSPRCRCSARTSGFRPYCPDHLPVIGEDPRAPGLIHACGHEGAGIGLAAATAHLLAQHVTGRPTDLDLAPFRPDRFADDTAVSA